MANMFAGLAIEGEEVVEAAVAAAEKPAPSNVAVAPSQVSQDSQAEFQRGGRGDHPWRLCLKALSLTCLM